MGQLQSNFDFTGKLGKLSAYKMRGSDNIIIRRKGGPSKNRIKTSPDFHIVRKNNAEFGARSTGSRWIRMMLHPLTSLGDFNAAGPINALIKPIQALDTINERGQRSIEFSKDPTLLHGFNLNKRNTFDSIIRNPLTCTINRANLSATVDIPQLIPSINFFNPGKHAFYSIVAVIGIVPDLFYTENGYKTSWKRSEEPGGGKYEASEWYSSLEGSKPTTLNLQYPYTLPNQAFALMLSVGIKFGTMGIGGAIKQVPYAGAAKILTTN